MVKSKLHNNITHKDYWLLHLLPSNRQETHVPGPVADKWYNPTISHRRDVLWQYL